MHYFEDVRIVDDRGTQYAHYRRSLTVFDRHTVLKEPETPKVPVPLPKPSPSQERGEPMLMQSEWVKIRNLRFAEDMKPVDIAAELKLDLQQVNYAILAGNTYAAYLKQYHLRS